MQEKYLEHHLRNRVRELGGIAYKLGGSLGLPDRLVLLTRGRMGFLETKTPEGSRSKAQRIVHGKLKALGFHVFTVKTREQLEDALAHILYDNPC